MAGETPNLGDVSPQRSSGGQCSTMTVLGTHGASGKEAFPRRFDVDQVGLPDSFSDGPARSRREERF